MYTIVEVLKNGKTRPIVLPNGENPRYSWRDRAYDLCGRMNAAAKENGLKTTYKVIEK